jgi:predicted negative regulator of RcsB-dependent stress response
MAKHLDLEEQEQLAEIRAFWKAYGNLITWTLVLVLSGFAAWNAWNWWQADQGKKSAGLFDELGVAAQAQDIEKVQRALGDLQERFPSTTFASQGALLAAKLQLEKAKTDDAVRSLAWVAEKGSSAELTAVARLRWSALLMDQKKWDEALAVLSQISVAEFEALAQDRRGDILAAQGKRAEAVAAYEKARAAMDAELDYRRLVEAKLAALGAAPAAPAASEAK